jgi:Tol biopolymer transport system component
MYRRTLTTLLLAGVMVVALVVAPAGARPRGVNGQITFDRLTDPASGAKEVLVANPDGSHARILVPTNPVSCCADFSPDGSKLVFPYPTADGRIGTAIINADGTGYTPFPIDDPLNTGTLNVGCGTGSWSPDGTRLACETWDDSTPATTARNGVYTISSADGSGLTRITANPLGGHDVPGSYSPDGKRIVFIRYDANGNSAGMFVVKTNDRQVRQILPTSVIINGGVQEDWSPQGNEIIFELHVTPNVFASIWEIHANGSGLHQLHIKGLACGGSSSDFHSFGCHEPRWSPDGKKIIFAANSPATGVNIYTANADGTGLAQVTFDGLSDDPAWGTHPLAH